MKMKQRMVVLSVFLSILTIAAIARRHWIPPGTTPTPHIPRSSLETYPRKPRLHADSEAGHTQEVNHQTNKISNDGEKGRTRNLQGRSSNLSSVDVDPWKLWHEWVKEESFYPEGAFHSGKMWRVLRAMSETPITKFGVGVRGTQLKASVVLQGGQKAVFKPKRCGYVMSEVCF